MTAAAELIRLSAALESACGDSLAPMLAERARWIAAVAAGPAGEEAAAALRLAAESGARLRGRLLVEQARRRGELGQLYRAGCLARALSAGPASSVLDCRG